MKRVVVILACMFTLTLLAGCISENQGKESDKNKI